MQDGLICGCYVRWQQESLRWKFIFRYQGCHIFTTTSTVSGPESWLVGVPAAPVEPQWSECRIVSLDFHGTVAPASQVSCTVLCKVETQEELSSKTCINKYWFTVFELWWILLKYSVLVCGGCLEGEEVRTEVTQCYFRLSWCITQVRGYFLWFATLDLTLQEMHHYFICFNLVFHCLNF